jgi:TRAP transporter TAXI family solute receptor
MKHAIIVTRFLLAISFLILPSWPLAHGAEAKLDCGPVTNKSNDLPRAIAIGTNPAGTGAYSLAAGLAAVASKATPITAKVQPYNGPNTWMPLMENGEIEFGIINILDSYMAARGTGNYKKASPSIRVVNGGVFPFTGSVMVRDKSAIKQIADLKGKRIAWDYGGHTVTQTWLNALLEVGGVKSSDMSHVRVSTVNDGIRGVAEGRIDASFSAIGIGTIEEANAMEPIRFLSLPTTDAANKILSRYGGSVVKAEPTAGIRGDTHVIGYPLHLVSTTRVSEKTVATLVKVWWDNLAELQTIHPLFKRWTKDHQVISNFTIPYHPGAIKFYREAGAWTDKHEARVKEICS